jgi:hypothetical protein
LKEVTVPFHEEGVRGSGGRVFGRVPGWSFWAGVERAALSRASATLSLPTLLLGWLLLLLQRARVVQFQFSSSILFR